MAVQCGSLIVNPCTDGRACVRAVANLDQAIEFLQLEDSLSGDLVRQTREHLAISKNRPTTICVTAPECFGAVISDLRVGSVNRVAVTLDCIAHLSAICEAIEEADVIGLPTRFYASQILSGPLGQRHPRLQASLASNSHKIRIVPLGARDAFLLSADLDGNGIRATKRQALSALRSQLKLRECALPLVVVVSRIAQQKQLDVALPAVEAAVASGMGQALVWLIESDAELRDAEYIHRFREFAQDRADTIDFRILPRNVAPEVTQSVLTAADIGLFSSDSTEPFGIWPLEALGCGTLIVGCPTGVLSELAEEVYSDRPELLVDPANPCDFNDRFTSTVLGVCDELTNQPSELDELRRRGIAAAAQRSWKAVLPRYRSLLGMSAQRLPSTAAIP